MGQEFILSDKTLMGMKKGGIPLFVAFNALGILPIFTSLTTEMSEPEQKRVIRQSILTAFLASIGFLAEGKTIFALLEISVFDFQIAGGILLFIIQLLI